MRSAVELAQLWRSDKVLRKLEAMMIVCDKEKILILTGTGKVKYQKTNRRHRLTQKETKWVKQLMVQYG